MGSTDGEDDMTQMLQLLEHRAGAIERRLQGDAPDLSDPVERVKEHCHRVEAHSIRFKWVLPNYYDTSLEERAAELGCLKEQLCKTMVMENKACMEHTPGCVDPSDPTSSRFYMVVVQYAAKLSSQKLSTAIMRLKPTEGSGGGEGGGEGGREKVSRGRFNLQVAPEEVSLTLSGFPHNGVSVFGGLAPMPVIISDAVMGLRSEFIWIGGGHPLLKLGVSTNDLVNGLGAIAADISVPRDGQSAIVEDDGSAL